MTGAGMERIPGIEAEIGVGTLDERQVMAIATRIMRDNQYACFDVEGTRANIRSAAEHTG